MRKHCCLKAYNYFFIYLPTVSIVGLMLMTYGSYVFDYVLVLVRVNKNTATKEDFIFYKTTSIASAHTKGITLLVLTLVLFTLLLVSLLRTVFHDPGYFPSPLELEYKILMCDKGEGTNPDEEYLNRFSDAVLNGPLTLTEQSHLEKNLREKSLIKLGEDYLQSKYTNEEIISQNKFKYSNNNRIPPTPLCCGSNYDVYLDIYRGVDLTKMNFCSSCLRLKVERSHHCRQCQKCVLKMDHHCPWLANCIGFYNLKYFLLLQLYGIILCSIFTLTYWEAIFGYNFQFETHLAMCWWVISVYLLNIGLFAFLIWLALINWRNLVQGQTVIEHSERVRFPSTKSKNVYDMGFRRNFTNVFGRNPLVWFIPFFPNLNGRGYVFETNTSNFYIK